MVQGFFSVLLEALGMFLAFDFCPHSIKPRHLKSGVPPRAIVLRTIFFYIYAKRNEGQRSYLYGSLLGPVISVLGFIFQVFCFFLHVGDGSLQLAFGLRKSIRLVLSRRQVFDRLLTLLFGLSTETLGLSKNKNSTCLAHFSRAFSRINLGTC